MKLYKGKLSDVVTWDLVEPIKLYNENNHIIGEISIKELIESYLKKEHFK